MSVKYYEKLALEDMARLEGKPNKSYLNTMLEHLNMAQTWCLNVHKREQYRIIIATILDLLLLESDILPESVLNFRGNTQRLDELKKYLPEILSLTGNLNPNEIMDEHPNLIYDDSIALQSLFRGLLARTEFKRLANAKNFDLRMAIPYQALSTNENEHLANINKKFEINKQKMRDELSILESRITAIEVPLYLTKLWIEFRLWYMKIEKENKSFPKIEQVDEWFTKDLALIESEFYTQSFKNFEFKSITINAQDTELQQLCKKFLNTWPLEQIEAHWHLGHSKYLLYFKALKTEIDKSKEDLPIKLKLDLEAAVIESQKDLKKIKGQKGAKPKKPKGDKGVKSKKGKDLTGGWTIEQMLQELAKLKILTPFPENHHDLNFHSNGDIENTLEQFYKRSIFNVQWPLLALNEEIEKAAAPEVVMPSKIKKDSKVTPIVEVEKKVGISTLLYGNDLRLMMEYSEKIAFNSSALMLVLKPSLLKGLYEDNAEIAKLVYMTLAVAKAYQPTILVLDEVDLIFAKKLKNCDFNPKRFKKELVKQKKSIKPSDHVQIVGIAGTPYESDPVSLKSYFQTLVYLPKMRRDELIVRLGQLNSKYSSLNLNQYGNEVNGFSYEQFIAFEEYVEGHQNNELILKYVSGIGKTNWSLYEGFNGK